MGEDKLQRGLRQIARVVCEESKFFDDLQIIEKTFAGFTFVPILTHPICESGLRRKFSDEDALRQLSVDKCPDVVFQTVWQ